MVLRDAGAPVELVPRSADIPETIESGATLEDNARLKALDVSTWTGQPAIADDTGLEVDALDGEPGRSFRALCGRSCVLLRQRCVAARAPERRRRTGAVARFATVAIARWPDGREVAAIGTVEGRIAPPRGDGGFGYDPVFVPDDGDGRTFAEMSPAEKHACSHRGRAFRTLADGLRVVAELGDD